MSARLWLCADLTHPRADTVVERVERALRGCDATVWLRSGASTPTRAIVEVARALRVLTRARGCALFVGDRLDVALAVEADGVHLPERSFHPSALRSIPLRRSRSVHTAEAAAGHRDVEFLVVSPFGPVPEKGVPLGEQGLRRLCDAARETRVIALGGISTRDHLRACLSAGAWGVAVRRALLDGDSPDRACAELDAALAELTSGHAS